MQDILLKSKDCFVPVWLAVMLAELLAVLLAELLAVPSVPPSSERCRAGGAIGKSQP